MTKFTKSILKIILPLASLGFFLIASVVVLIISQGRIFEDDGSIVQTGIIRINSIPQDEIEAYINDQKVDVNDDRITNINPGIVNLRLTKTGYTPWEKQIKVESGIVKDVYVQLYPNSIPFKKVTNTNVDKTFYSKDGQYIYYFVLNGSTSDGVWRIKLSRNLLDFTNSTQITQIIKLNEIEKSELKQNEYELITAYDNNKLILRVGTNYYLYDLADTTKRIDLNKETGLTMSNIQWFANSQSIIFAHEGKYTFEYNLSTKQRTLIEYNEKQDTSLAVTSNNIYFIKDNVVMIYSNNAVSKFVFPKNITSLLPAKLSNVYTSTENSNVLILAADDTLLYVDLLKDFIDVIDTRSTFYKSLSSGRLITYFKNDELHTYYVEDTFNEDILEAYNYNLAINKDAFTNLEFAATGKNLVLFKENSITLMDYDGLNTNTILKDFNFIENKILFTNNSTEVYALIQEKDDEGLTVNEIYKFELKIEN